jgi:excinuclease ABC subunit C
VSANALITNPHEHPTTPGVYLFKDAKGRVLYVGKARNLRSRLASYFRGTELLPSKTRAMLGRAAAVDTLCTTTEKEALLLESSLIKKHRPRYNICLRDDKQYVLFKLDAQADYPRLTLTRRVLQDGALYFGPFTSSQAARQTLKAVHRLFPLRRCKETVFRNRVRPCLYQHMGQCLGPCVLDVPREEYADMVRRVRLFLAGKSGELAAHLKAAMHEHAERLEYEKAAEVRDLLRGISRTLEQQAAVLPDGLDRDVVGFVRDHHGLGLSVLFVRQGRLLDRKDFSWPMVDQENRCTADEEMKALETSAEMQELLDSFLVQFYGPEQFIPERIVLPVGLKNPHVVAVLTERRGGAVRLAAARGADEKRLVEMAAANAREAMQRSEPDAFELLGGALGLPRPPERIEAVDVSHLSGQGTVVGMVVFEQGRPLKSAYRAYAFPDLEGSRDDYLALSRWAERRVGSGPPWPDLVLVDGGLGQLSAVNRALDEAGVAPSWPLVGIVKTGRRAGELDDRIFLPGRRNPLPLKPGSLELLFLQRLRDAAHRFALSRQRRGRKKTTLDSRLSNLKGIGPKTAKLLWEHFPDIKAMHRATVDDLTALPGMGVKRATRLHEALGKLQEEKAQSD